MNDMAPVRTLSDTGRPILGLADLSHLRADFPILSETVRGKKLVFLDSAASAQKPEAVIEAMSQTMRTQRACATRSPG